MNPAENKVNCGGTFGPLASRRRIWKEDRDAFTETAVFPNQFWEEDDSAMSLCFLVWAILLQIRGRICFVELLGQCMSPVTTTTDLYMLDEVDSRSNPRD